MKTHSPTFIAEPVPSWHRRLLSFLADLTVNMVTDDQWGEPDQKPPARLVISTQRKETTQP